MLVSGVLRAMPVQLQHHESGIRIGEHLDVLVDPESNWTLDQVRNQFASRFHASDKDELNFGFTDSTIWLRFTLDASKVAGESWFLVERYPILDHLTLFAPDGQGGFIIHDVGDTKPFSQRPMKHRAFVFDLDTRLKGPQQYFLRVRGKGALNLMPMLYTAKGLVEYTYVEELLVGLFYGALVIMMIYNVMLLLALRDRVYLYFVLFLAGIIFFNLNVNGLGLQYLWPNTPRLDEYFWLGSYLCSASLAMYSRRFLQLAERFPRYDGLLKKFLVLLGGSFLTEWLLPPPWSYHLSMLMTLITVVLFSWLGWTVWRQGFRVARLYVLGWSVFLGLVLIFALGNLGLLPYNTVISYLPHAGALWVVMMLSLALGDWVRFLEKEREQLSRDAQTNLERHLADIAQMNRDKSTFLQYISHELNTPINWIGAADSLGSDGASNAEVDVWAMVRKGQRRLMGIVGTSLRYFDLADREQTPMVSSCQPMWILDGLLNDHATRIEQRELTVRNRIAPNLQVRANEAELGEVINIALDNAVRFSDDKGTVEITSRVDINQGHADICFSDQGRGASPEQLERIFEPFFVMGSRHHEEGFGLSLASAREMIEQVDGRLWAQSPGPGRGFTLHIRLQLI
ncbi:MAG: sensor histidine kinase [Alcanivorax sp.]|nr:sensor histidine kinase [Alcanivorax sp.]